jgi:hypothetical protein
MVLRSECDKCMGRGWYQGYSVAPEPIAPCGKPVAVNVSFEIIKIPCSCTPSNQRRVRSARSEYEEKKAIAFDVEAMEYRIRNKGKS